jgi:lactobin A/cerein 7B family class IIb bacteriocin
MKDLNEKELKKIEGGVLPAWLIFTGGAILGGALYDVYKAGCKAVVEAGKAGTYEGIPSCKR